MKILIMMCATSRETKTWRKSLACEVGLCHGKCSKLRSTKLLFLELDYKIPILNRRKTGVKEKEIKQDMDKYGQFLGKVQDFITGQIGFHPLTSCIIPMHPSSSTSNYASYFSIHYYPNTEIQSQNQFANTAKRFS